MNVGKNRDLFAISAKQSLQGNSVYNHIFTVNMHSKLFEIVFYLTAKKVIF